MHEYGLMEEVVARALTVCGSQPDRRAVRVRIEVGEFAVASPDSLETAYEILTAGTALAGSSLEMTQTAGRATCLACGFAGTASDLGDEVSEPPALLLCPRCGSVLLVTQGAGITLIDVQLEDRGSLTETVPGGR